MNRSALKPFSPFATQIDILDSYLPEREPVVISVMGRHLVNVRFFLVHVKHCKIQGQATVAGSNL